ncbi:hypothetical protein FSARC_363 [Fusarium sarcochroum]|uniref:FAD-binding domain-containing protein n=1 Tax=Fusarium sarcochroum TaxID=1208366 RepID=A0A8H4UBC0_9HYPO|nr:hypothetical protein FSARC_363 [Fusarium sarcochroum]
MSTAKPILIAGSGLSSLLLAQSLKLSKIPFKIFERDASFDKCGQTTGAGYTAYNAVSGEETEHIVPENLSSRDGKIVGIARGDMRKVFAENCEPYIEWAKNVTGYELTDDGVRAIFSDGSKSIEGSLLVGGEGIYSKIAKQLSGGKLKVYDTGAKGIHGQAPTTAFKQLGEGVFRLRDDSGPDGSVFIITNVRAGDMDNPDVKFGWTMGGKPAADLAKSITQNWHPRFRPLFENMDESEAAFWKITCSTPSGVPEWKNEPRVTVIGDAAHSMTPAGGLGANTACQDSALLGKLLREAGGYGPDVTAAYEKEMRVYASKAVNESYTLAKKAFGVDIDEENTPTV